MGYRSGVVTWRRLAITGGALSLFAGCGEQPSDPVTEAGRSLLIASDSPSAEVAQGAASSVSRIGAGAADASQSDRQLLAVLQARAGLVETRIASRGYYDTVARTDLALAGVTDASVVLIRRLKAWQTTMDNEALVESRLDDMRARLTMIDGTGGADSTEGGVSSLPFAEPEAYDSARDAEMTGALADEAAKADSRREDLTEELTRIREQIGEADQAYRERELEAEVIRERVRESGAPAQEDIAEIERLLNEAAAFLAEAQVLKGRESLIVGEATGGFTGLMELESSRGELRSETSESLTDAIEQLEEAARRARDARQDAETSLRTAMSTYESQLIGENGAVTLASSLVEQSASLQSDFVSDGSRATQGGSNPAVRSTAGYTASGGAIAGGGVRLEAGLRDFRLARSINDTLDSIEDGLGEFNPSARGLLEREGSAAQTRASAHFAAARESFEEAALSLGADTTPPASLEAYASELRASVGGSVLPPESIDELVAQSAAALADDAWALEQIAGDSMDLTAFDTSLLRSAIERRRDIARQLSDIWQAESGG